MYILLGCYTIHIPTELSRKSFVAVISTILVGGCTKYWCAVTSTGVPQGSVLGPLQFILYINDIPNIAHTNLSFFTDDSKVYSVIKTLEDSHQLQADLNSIQEWCQIWLLKLNLLKCKIMCVGNSPIVRSHTLYDDLGERIQLFEADHEEDLGVWFTSDLNHLYIVVRQ